MHFWITWAAFNLPEMGRGDVVWDQGRNAHQRRVFSAKIEADNEEAAWSKIRSWSPDCSKVGIEQVEADWQPLRL